MLSLALQISYYYEGDPTTGLPIFDVDKCSDDGLFGGEAGFAPRPEEQQADSETDFIIFSEIPSSIYRLSTWLLSSEDAHSFETAW